MPHINEYLSEITDIGSSTTDLYNTSSEVIFIHIQGLQIGYSILYAPVDNERLLL